MQPGHVFTVDHLWIVEVDLAEALGFFGQLRSDQFNLGCVSII